MPKSTFVRTTFNRGFKMKFKNGCEISVQWGLGNYCSRQDLKKAADEGIYADMHMPETESYNAEVLIESPHGISLTANWAEQANVSCDGNRYAGWLTTDQIADAIAWTKAFQIS